MSTALVPDRQNGNGASVPIRPDRGVVGPQMSASGTTTNQYGETSPDEYVTALADPEQRMAVFDEMRKSDEAVAAACDTRESLIRGANWDLSPAGDTPEYREHAEFVEDNLYPLLPDALLHLGGGRVQYGFGLLEKVFAWSDEPFARSVARGKVRRAVRRLGRRMLYLRKLAHVRQRTVTTFVLYPDGPNKGDLRVVRQYAANAGALRWQAVDIPAERVLLTTYNRQGDDHWGNPPTRSAYRAWYIKQQLEKLNALNIDRFGVGTPVIEGGEGWSDTDFTTAFNYAQLWRSGGQTALAFKKGGKVEIKTGDGSMVTSISELAKYYALSIHMVYQTQGTQLSLNSDAGARSLGESFLQQLEGATQADCEAIAELLNGLIVNLIDYNYGRQDAYPVFTPSQRVRAAAGMATVIGNLITSGALKVRASDEPFLRDVFGMPPVEIQTVQAEMDDPEAVPFNPEAIYPIAAAKSAGLLSWSAEDENWVRRSTAMPEIDAAARQAELDAQADALAAASAALANGGNRNGRTEDDDQEGGGQAPPRPGSNAGPRRVAASSGAHGAVRPAAPGHRANAGAASARSAASGAARPGAGGQAGDDAHEREGGRAHGAVGGRRSATATPAHSADARAGRAGAPTLLAAPSEPTTEPSRRGLSAEWLAREERIGRFRQLAHDLDASALRASDEAQDVLRRMDADLAADAERVAARGSLAALADLTAEIAVAPALVEELAAALEVAALRAREIGANSVAMELARQTGAEPVEPARAPAAATLAALPSRLTRTIRLARGEPELTEEEARDAALRSAVLTAAKAEAGRRENAARDAITRALADGAVTAAAVTVAAALAVLSRNRTAQAATEVVNTGFGAGRADGVRAALATHGVAPSALLAPASSGTDVVPIPSSITGGVRAPSGAAPAPPVRVASGAPGDPGIVAAVYSAVMDLGTCDACAELDGGEYPPDQPTRTGPGEVKAPNPRCAGGRRCRCVWIMVLADESAAADGPTAPEARGPGRGVVV